MALDTAGDDPRAVRDYFQRAGYTMPAAMAGWQGDRGRLLGVTDQDLGDQYGVTSFPTNLVIDRTGRIVARFGSDWKPAEMAAALRRAGLPSTPRSS